jgi:hypothetical protein
LVPRLGTSSRRRAGAARRCDTAVDASMCHSRELSRERSLGFPPRSDLSPPPPPLAVLNGVCGRLEGGSARPTCRRNRGGDRRLRSAFKARAGRLRGSRGAWRGGGCGERLGARLPTDDRPRVRSRPGSLCDVEPASVAVGGLAVSTHGRIAFGGTFDPDCPLAVFHRSTEAALALVGVDLDRRRGDTRSRSWPRRHAASRPLSSRAA